MNWLHKLRLRFRALFHKEKFDARMDDEMRSHIEMQAQANIDAGMKPDEARYAEMRQFGSVESIKESVIALLGTLGLFAGWLPARRAGKVDPMVASSYE